jgi:hypothetical protein
MSEFYIKIENGLVVNLIIMDPNVDEMDQKYVWIPLGLNKCTDGTPITINKTTYDGTNFISNIIIDINTLKSEKINKFIVEILAFVSSRYDLEKRVNFLGIYNNALNKGLVNRATYFQKLLDWQNEVYTYSAQIQYAIFMLSTINEINLFGWDFTHLIESDPLVSYNGAFSILD